MQSERSPGTAGGAWCGRHDAPMPRRRSPKYASKAQVEAAGVNRVSLWRSVKLGLLPKPTLISDGHSSGVHAGYPGWAIERARWVRRRRDEMLRLDEIVEFVRAGEAPGSVAQ